MSDETVKAEETNEPEKTYVCIGCKRSLPEERMATIKDEGGPLCARCHWDDGAQYIPMPYPRPD